MHIFVETLDDVLTEYGRKNLKRPIEVTEHDTMYNGERFLECTIRSVSWCNSEFVQKIRVKILPVFVE